MNITIITIFPKLFQEWKSTSIIKKAQVKKKVTISIVDLRSFSKYSNNQVDDAVYGGGAGMVLMIEPMVAAIRAYKTNNSKVYILEPIGKKWNQQLAFDCVNNGNDLIFVAGHYEGIDNRVSNYVDGFISIGDFIVTGGEIPIMLVCESIIRLIPGVINRESLKHESFGENFLLDYPVYTKPSSFENFSVPEVLLSGNHKKIDEYRFNMRKKITKINRPDLYKKYLLCEKRGKNATKNKNK